MAVSLVVLFFISLFLGRYPLSPNEVIKILASKFIPLQQPWDATAEAVIWKVRVPRLTAALLVGSGLSISGASFQGLFRNALVSPHILGVAAGAGFGASVAILLLEDPFLVQLAAFVFGLLAVVVTFYISRVYKESNTLVLVLSGIIVGALFTALISLIKYVADPFDTLPAIVFWLMGSLASVSNKELSVVILPMSLGIIVLLLIRWKINILSMGEKEAKAMGVNTNRLMAVIIVCSTMITASAVCISGIIGWVGLVIPHFSRMIVGPDHKALLPASLLLGALYLLAIDDCARMLISTEIPLRILTAIVGAPFFAFLLRKSKVGWSRS